MQITDISVQKNNPKKFNLFIDGAFFSGVSPKIILEEKLSAGLNIDSNYLTDLSGKIIQENMTADALNYLSFRLRSKFEVKQHLLTKSLKNKISLKKFEISLNPELLIENIITKLTGLGYLDDRKFVLWWFSQRQDFNQKSIFLIKKELLQKGIDEKLIKDVILEDKEDIKSDLENAKKIMSKRLGRWSSLPEFAKKQKIRNFLSSRGFSYETIEKVIDSYKQKD